MNNELLYQVALTFVPHIGDVHAKILLEKFGDAASIFKASRRELERVEGIGPTRAKSLKSFDNYSRCESEIRFLEKYHIHALFISSENYPKRLRNCPDGPVMLYYKGNGDLNARRIISIVGTRNNSDYGKQLCEEIITGLNDRDVLIVSGLAFGIDTIAHKAALKAGLNTVATLAHGLDRIYPNQNKTLARQMTSQGGLLTDFPCETLPDKQNFPRRNRIVAGICDALIVIESGTKGGSLITAELANDYHKDVFALPGRANDPKSEGCHLLIMQNKAQLLTSARDLISFMNWDQHITVPKRQRELFIDLSPEEKQVLKIMEDKKETHIDMLYLSSGLSSSKVAAVLLSLEMQGVIRSNPGKMYSLSG